jgi:hypothetical protein
VNLDELQAAVKRFGFDDSDPLTTWLNAALYDFTTAENWTFLEAVVTPQTTAGEDNLILPSDLDVVHTMREVNTIPPLTYLSRILWESQIVDPTATGLPTHYTLIGLNTALLWPVPDAGYNIRVFYHKNVPELVGDTDIPAIPVKYHFALVQRAASIALQAENNEDRADAAQTQYNEIIGRAAVKGAGDHQSASFGQVQDAQEYGF